MLKICGPSICKPLEIIFKSCLESGIFPLEWKKANFVPVYRPSQTGCTVTIVYIMCTQMVLHMYGIDSCV